MKESTITPTDALDYMEAQSKGRGGYRAFRNFRVEGEAEFPHGKNAGTPGLRISFELNHDDSWRGLKAGERIAYVVIRRQHGKKTRYAGYDAETMERIRAFQANQK